LLSIIENLKKLLQIIILLFSIPLVRNSFSQEVPQSVSNKALYEFLDELASKQIITLNSAVKPYSRLFISNALWKAVAKKDLLTARQQNELDFYMKDFVKEQSDGDFESGRVYIVQGKNKALRRDLFFYKDSLFSLTINPILGGEIFSNSSGKANYTRNGAEARGYIGRWGFFASLRDNHEDPLLGKPQYLSLRIDGHIKNRFDWSEMKGGVTYSWKWGSAGLVKDDIQWGNNYNGANIFGGNNPSFIQLRLHISPVKWFDFNYFHGWLNSMVVDSNASFWVSNSYGTDYREVYHKKYIAASMFTFTPFKYLNISAGNSIVYDNENVNPAYLVPVFFYKSVDHSITSGINNMNSQMFFDVSSRQIRNLHLYATMYIDELSTSRFTKKDQWNFLSYKAGFRLTDLPVANLSFTTEFTYTYPLAFQHDVPTLTFNNAGYNLGYYLKDNSREWYLAFDYRPFRTMDVKLYFSDAIRGPDYTELGTNRIGNPPLSSVEWHSTEYGLKASCQVINDVFCWFSYSAGNTRGDDRWSAQYFFGKKNTVNAGISIGF
jgi:hypothetical protein